jgi:hypothetical protein
VRRSFDRLVLYFDGVAIIVGTRRRIIAFLNGILQRAVAVHVAVGAIKVRNGTTENSFLHRSFSSLSDNVGIGTLATLPHFAHILSCFSLGSPQPIDLGFIECIKADNFSPFGFEHIAYLSFLCAIIISHFGSFVKGFWEIILNKFLKPPQAQGSPHTR